MTDTLIRLIADGLVLPVVLLGTMSLLFFVPKSGRLQSYSRILMAGLTAYLAAKLLGSIYQPDLARPFEQLGVAARASFLDNPGFPSDHVLFCTAITLAVWFETKRRKLAVILFGMTFLVALGRVLALVHTPLDVLGGFIIAFAGVPWYLQRPSRQIKSATRQKHKNGIK